MFKNPFYLAEQPYNEADAEWDAFVAAHPHGSILQTTNWARLKGRFGWRSWRVWVREQGQLVAGAQLLFRSRALGLLRMGYMPHGPLTTWDNRELTDVLFNQIDRAVWEHRASLLKIEPLLWQHEAAAETWQSLSTAPDMHTAADTVQPPRTMILDLTQSEEQLLAAMKPKTRYNIRLAERKEVTVRPGESADLPAFTRLMAHTGQRNAFGTHAPEYYRAAWELFAPDGNAALWLAEFDGRPLAGVMVFTCGQRASYLFGGSSDQERQRMPSYAAQWAAIRWAKAQGCTTYDLWGVPDADEETLEAQFEERNDGLWGVYRFKRGWGGQIVRTVGCTDRVYNELFYRLYKRQRGGRS
jgi:lipid II:glycine glycyltransferase (peptidoglycan interpeptide bridge formation enzyme)